MKSKASGMGIFWNNVIYDEREFGVIEKINGGELLQVLQLPLLKDIVSFSENKEENITNNWKTKIRNHALKCESVEMEMEFLGVGVASLLLFIQVNWTGPKLKIEEFPLLKYDNEKLLANQRKYVLEELVMDGENIVSVAQYPEFLLLSRLILNECYNRISSKITPFWYMRSLFVHQEILEESSLKLFEEISNVMNEIRNIVNEYENKDLTEFYLEFSKIHLYYNYIQKSKLDIEKALDYSCIQTTLIGVLGKRTKFQYDDLAQLTLKVDIVGNNDNSENDPSSEVTFPVDIKLEDEVRLNKIKFKNDSDGKHPNLNGLQQASILAVFCQTQKSQPKDRLTDEELQPLISCILDKPKLWSVKLTTLLFRSRLESNHKRSIERSMLQIQTLVDSLDGDKPGLLERLKYFFISHQPPRWEIESSLARILISMGAFKSALDVYLKLEDWENVIYCYNILEMRHKAQEIIEQELKKNPTPKLWCYLGDSTGDVSHYETAWKLSKGKSARVQRHWAMHYYNRREYDKSIKHFELSLEKNSLQSELWYSLGYAALHEEKWEISANAYRRYCILDPECFEAWNNLARCYCELKQKRRAWRALQEALKVDYSNWRVWDNYMLVSSDLGEFDEVMRSYHQILNMKEKHVDIPILSNLVQGFKEFEEEMKNKEDSVKELKKFREKLLTLFGRLTSQVVGQSELWYLYSKIVPEDTEQDRVKKQQLLLKSYNATVNRKTWVKTIESCKEVMNLLSELIDASISVGQKNILVSCQLSVRGCLTVVKKEHPGTEICRELEEKLDELGELLGKDSH